MILVTGANGFVGTRVVQVLTQASYAVRAAARRPLQHLPREVQWCASPVLDAQADWRPALKDVTCIVHCAARVHVMHDTTQDPLQTYREVNLHGTLRLAEQAVAAGVKRFIFLSSIKVNGEATEFGQPFTAQATPQPVDPYGLSKWEAEQALFELSKATGLEIVVIRPPLVYGPGVKANFLAMMQWVARGIPLPLGAARHNRRSFVSLDNLVDLIRVCVNHPAAAQQTFLVSDDHDLSTAELLQRMAKALKCPSRLLPVPTRLLEFSAKLLGKGAIAQRLLGNLQLDINATRRCLDWTPPLSVDEGLRQVAATFTAASHS